MGITSTLIDRLKINRRARCTCGSGLDAVGCLFALPGLSMGNWRRALLGSLAQWSSWGSVTPLILWADGRLPFSRKQLPQRLLTHLLPSLICTSLYVYIFAGVLRSWVRHGARCGTPTFSRAPYGECFCGVGWCIG